MTASFVRLKSLGAGVEQDSAGDVLSGRPVYVYQRGTTTQIQVYSDNAGANPVTQPLQTDASGGVPGYVASPVSGDILDQWSQIRQEFEAIAATDVSGTAGSVTAETTRAEAAEALLAPKASPAFTGSPTAPTPAALDDSAKVATTAYADGAVAVEKARALAAEGTNATAIAAETTRAEAAEATNASAISAEVTRAEAAEALKASLAASAGGADTATVGRTSTIAAPVLRDFVSVVDFGADPTGASDSTAAVQSAMNAVQTAGGVVWVPAGEFYLNESGAGGLTVNRNGAGLTLQGAAMGATTFKLSSNCPNFLIANKIADYDVFSNCTVKGMTIDANNVVHGQLHVVAGTRVSTGTYGASGTIQMRLNFDNWLFEDIDVINIPYDTAGVNLRKAFGFEIYQASTGEATQNYMKHVRWRRCRVNPYNVATSGGNQGWRYLGILSDGTNNAANVLIDNCSIEDCSHRTGHVAPGSAFCADVNIHLGSLGQTINCAIRRFHGEGSGDVGIEMDDGSCVVDDCEITDACNNAFLMTKFGAVANVTNQRYTLRNCRVKILNLVPDGVSGGTGVVAKGFGNASGTVALTAVDLIDCTYSSNQTAPFVTGQVVAFSVACPDVSIRGLRATFPSLNMAPAAATTANLVLYSTDRATSTFSINGLSIKLAGTQTTAFKMLTRFVYVDAPSADVTIDLRNLTFNYNITSLVAGSMVGIELGDGAATTMRGLIDGVRWTTATGDTAPLGINIASTATLTLDDALYISRLNTRKFPSGTSISCSGTQRNNVFVSASDFQTNPITACGGSSTIALSTSPEAHQITALMDVSVIVDDSAGSGNVTAVAWSQDSSAYYTLPGPQKKVDLKNGQYIKVTWGSGTAPTLRIFVASGRQAA